MTSPTLQAAFEKHDSAIASLGFDIWVGMEPTFTQRYAETSEWLSEALGPEKLSYAYKMLDEMRRVRPGGIVVHSLGRQYSGEALPRWCIGYYTSRNGSFVWNGPEDPRHAVQSQGCDDPEAFWLALADRLNRSVANEPWQALTFQVDEKLGYRLLLRCDGEQPVVDMNGMAALSRPSVHSHKIPLDGLVDELAARGDLLLSIGTIKLGDESQSVALELPYINDVAVFIELMHGITEAAEQCSLGSLRLMGFPPPVDATIAWTTLTPDPAVVEVNMAPSTCIRTFYERTGRCYEAADTIGLFPYRLQYNGVVWDSGGGGQFTIGGPSALDSPFLKFPALLPRLIRYLNAHPSLSYWFAPPSIGSCSQSPRPDEGLPDSFRELEVALEQLERTENPTPEYIWRILSPFMVDPSGNQHRSELNIEKLWNPYLPGRGCLGLVEFRAFKMPRSAESAAAIACLLRAVVAMLIRENKTEKLTVYGGELHDKYALPFYLKQDLERVFDDLNEAGLGLGREVEASLSDDSVRIIARSRFQGYRIELEQALEFWPLIGDVSSQERGGSRLIDASTSRLQLSVRPEPENVEPALCPDICVQGQRMPLRYECDGSGPVWVFGLRYRSFMPIIGLHPGIPSLSRIDFALSPPGGERLLKFNYHEWHPEGIAYPGLPDSIEEAERRRIERLVVREEGYAELTCASLPSTSLSEFCVDLRRVA